ncbi:homoserine dehydrogenase [Mesobacillus maritimus]|uniref:Homoserine dehydrogenase n=1 Tax=Mesobacillus maritimus TaxID=1643336 RepID=A0ABS7K7G3_9BACI|nr:homoserine dehydrogenase [Mesobacillus maritimus]MBY0098030.1 homoserine dehydrogenase [Mesobacillus maritimus]
MSSIRVAILGFGTVGEGVYKTIYSHQDKLSKALGKRVEVAAILIKNKNKYKNRGIDNRVLVTDDYEEILKLEKLDVVVEAIVGQEPALTYLQKAIQKGCHIITANKEMFAVHGSKLQDLAMKRGVGVGFEATVAGGVPVIQTLQQLLNINRIKKIEGILNGTSNYILSEMRTNHLSFSEALQAAQEKGYAEADPTNDVEGYDAFYKLMILSEIAFGGKPEWANVPREGITTITEEQIKGAEKLGLRFKLIASIQIVAGEIVGSVRPTLVTESHPLFNIEGVENSVSIEGDIVGRLTLQGPGAGMLPTASAVIEDLIHVVRANHHSLTQFSLKEGVGLVEDADEEGNQNWLMIHPGEAQLTSVPVSVVTETDHHIYLKADEPTITTLRKRNHQASFFEVLGEFQLKKSV